MKKFQRIGMVLLADRQISWDCALPLESITTAAGTLGAAADAAQCDSATKTRSHRRRRDGRVVPVRGAVRAARRWCGVARLDRSGYRHVRTQPAVIRTEQKRRSSSHRHRQTTARENSTNKLCLIEIPVQRLASPGRMFHGTLEWGRAPKEWARVEMERSFSARRLGSVRGQATDTTDQKHQTLRPAIGLASAGVASLGAAPQLCSASSSGAVHHAPDNPAADRPGRHGGRRRRDGWSVYQRARSAPASRAVAANRMRGVAAAPHSSGCRVGRRQLQRCSCSCATPPRLNCC